MSPGARLVVAQARAQWRALAGAGGATVALTLADLAKPWPLALVVDHLLDGRRAPFALGAGDVRLLAVVAALILAISAVESLAQYGADVWLQGGGERITHELRVAVYDHLQRLSLAFHHGRAKGDLLTRVTEDANDVGQIFSSSLGELVQAGLSAAGMSIVLLVLDPVLGVLSLVTAPALVWISWVYRQRVRAQARLQRAREGQLASVANEALSAMVVVKAFGTEELESERIRRRSQERMGAGLTIARLQARFDGTVGVLRAVGTVLVTVVGVLRVAAGALTPGDLIVFVSYTRKAQSPLRSIAREAAKVATALARADRVAEVLAADDVVAERPGAYAGGRARGEVALERVSFSYGGRGRPAVERLWLKIPAGRCVALAGPSGAGKSTVAALIARLHDSATGRVLLDGRDVRDCRLDWLRRQIGIVLQDTVLFAGTVHDNIAYGTEATRDDVVAAARAAAADEFIRGLPAGYDTELGPQGVGLSGGQRQRIGIARTLLRDPPILILDEPTAALDADSEQQVLAGLEALMRGRTCLLISHAPRLLGIADEVVRLERGRIAAGAAAAREPALPVRELLDRERMLPVLAGCLAPGTEIDDVAVRRVAYAPGELIAVHYEVGIEGRRHAAVATSAVATDLAARSRLPRYAEQARKINGRSPADPPVHHDPELDALVTWLPYDPRLPALAEPPAELTRRLGLDGEPVLVRYKPRSRAVLRTPGHVLKAYGRSRQFEAAVAGLRISSRAPLRTPAFAGALADLRLTAQRRLDGRAPASALAVGREAGALVADLQCIDPESLSAAGPERLMETAARKAELIADLLPDLRRRVEAIVRRLADDAPVALPLLAAHGDFHADQLLVGEEGIAVVDFDGMCAAPPALDLASYAADVVRGRPSDVEAVQATLAALLDGYGRAPGALGWHVRASILARAAHPFHHQLPGWEERIEAMVAAAEGVG